MPVQNGQQDKPTTPALSSLWDGLSPHLIATFYEVDREGKRPKGTEDITVKAPILDGTFSVSLQWQSPFESSGAESKAPMLISMLQSGALQPMVDSLLGKESKASKDSKDFLSQFAGRTGITKLNSVQVFSGMPPVDYPVSLLFRAWRNPKTEVMNPLNQIMQWSLPQKLADQSTLLSRGIDAVKGKDDAINVLLPSKSPVMIAMNYKGMTISPMVIESVSYDSASPVDRNGDFVNLTVQIKLNSLAAIDKDDWIAFRKK